MVKKILISIVLIPFLILIFAPKKELFFLLQKQLAAKDIMISGGDVREHLFGLSIEHPAIYFKGIKIADVKSISLWTALLYTKGTVEMVDFDSSLGSYLPPKVDNLSIVHSVMKPTEVLLAVRDQALSGDGNLELKNRKMLFHFTKIPKSSPMSNYLKPNKGGWDYERSF